jgi:hypothetical protein
VGQGASAHGPLQPRSGAALPPGADDLAFDQGLFWPLIVRSFGRPVCAEKRVPARAAPKEARRYPPVPGQQELHVPGDDAVIVQVQMSVPLYVQVQVDPEQVDSPEVARRVGA